jgi:hypothetical protein
MNFSKRTKEFRKSIGHPDHEAKGLEWSGVHKSMSPLTNLP